MGQKLGQHFLINLEKLKKVSDALEITRDSVVIEVGPGHGELTQYLLEAGARVTALERDKALIEPLKEKFASFVIPAEAGITKKDLHYLLLNKLTQKPRLIRIYSF
ncbi:TPA: hypothetical protein DCS99_02050 [Candidatus Wolfebacteria bacterium]|nr:hypothetical protein [Candidatus Wolfebacteria bacterium]